MFKLNYKRLMLSDEYETASEKKVQKLVLSDALAVQSWS